MSARTEAVVAMTDHERIVALCLLAGLCPGVFDEVLRDVEDQRRIAAKREDRNDEGERDG